jgi:hypothetical protein
MDCFMLDVAHKLAFAHPCSNPHVYDDGHLNNNLYSSCNQNYVSIIKVTWSIYDESNNYTIFKTLC